MSVKRKKTITIEASELSSGQQYLNAKEELESFREMHRELFEVYASIVDRYNDAVEAVDKELRVKCADTGMGVSFSDFSFKHFTIKIDHERCFELVGKKQFETWRGKVFKREHHEMPKDSFLMLVDQGEVPTDVQDQVLTYTPNYSKPKKAVLPW